MGVTAFDTISATRVNIVNDAGKIQATITSDRDGGRVEIFDAAGQYQAILGVANDGGRLVFYDSDEKKAGAVGVDKADQGMALDAPTGNENNKITDDADKVDLLSYQYPAVSYNTTEMRYVLYLQTAEWRTLRRIKMEAAGHRCQVCNSDIGPIDVHHRTYERRGKERLGDLTVLCRRCHQSHHDAEDI